MSKYTVTSGSTKVAGGATLLLALFVGSFAVRALGIMLAAGILGFGISYWSSVALAAIWAFMLPSGKVQVTK